MWNTLFFSFSFFFFCKAEPPQTQVGLVLSLPRRRAVYDKALATRDRREARNLSPSWEERAGNYNERTRLVERLLVEAEKDYEDPYLELLELPPSSKRNCHSSSPNAMAWYKRWAERAVRMGVAQMQVSRPWT